VLYNEDCNTVIEKILSQIHNTSKNPLFVLIDPTGLQIDKETVKLIVGLRNPKDIMFNYILEGVRRTSGVARKVHSGQIPTAREIKTTVTLKRFIGNDINIIDRSDVKVLGEYVDSIFTSKNLKIVALDIPYPDRDDILYYLIFASRKPIITDIIKDIFAKEKERKLGPTLFGGKEYYKKEILTMTPKLLKIQRKSLLYKTKVEYGSWTINHVIGCMHGCKFPCYAMVMAKKFGWVKGYNDWRVPRIAENALEILEREIVKYRKGLDFVHLCFMSDPFMYDSEKQDLIPEVKDLSLKIIEKLNNEGIRVTTLTKGIYPDELIETRFLKDNEYGITLVSLNDEFKKSFEPYSSPYSNRIEALKKLHEAGLKTWVSIEPYPTPNLDKTAEGIESLLEKISFVDKIIFGRLNYNVASKKFIANEDFYKRMSNKVIEYCKRKGIKYHIKFGTPYSKNTTKAIFRS
jgi:DNA repair photolyase